MKDSAPVLDSQDAIGVAASLMRENAAVLNQQSSLHPTREFPFVPPAIAYQYAVHHNQMFGIPPPPHPSAFQAANIGRVRAYPPSMGGILVPNFGGSMPYTPLAAYVASQPVNTAPEPIQTPAARRRKSKATDCSNANRDESNSGAAGPSGPSEADRGSNSQFQVSNDRDPAHEETDHVASATVAVEHVG